MSIRIRTRYAYACVPHEDNHARTRKQTLRARGCTCACLVLDPQPGGAANLTTKAAVGCHRHLSFTRKV